MLKFWYSVGDGYGPRYGSGVVDGIGNGGFIDGGSVGYGGGLAYGSQNDNGDKSGVEDDIRGRYD